MGHPDLVGGLLLVSEKVGHPVWWLVLYEARLGEGGEGEVVVFGDADVAGGNVVDPAGDGEVAEGDGSGDRRVRLEVLNLEEDVLLGESVDEGAVRVR